MDIMQFVRTEGASQSMPTPPMVIRCGNRILSQTLIWIGFKSQLAASASQVAVLSLLLFLCLCPPRCRPRLLLMG